MRAVIVVVIMLVLLAACGGSRTGDFRGGDGPAGPDSPVSTSAPTSVTPSGRFASPEPPELVEPSPGMVEVSPIAWESAEVVGDRTVEITWTSGVRPCYVLDRVEVTADEQTVTITLFEGSAPSDEPVACIEIAKQKRTRVQLDSPVAGRQIDDGAGG